MQWMLPPPSRISRAGTPTTSRSGKQPRDHLGRALVEALVEQREDDARGRRVEVHVGGGQPVARAAGLRAGARDHPCGLPGLDVQRSGRRHREHLELAPARRRAPLPGACAHRVPHLVHRVRRVLAHGQEHHARPHEAGEVVDVAVGLVARHAAAEPDHLRRAEVVAAGPARSDRARARGCGSRSAGTLRWSAPCPRRRRGSSRPRARAARGSARRLRSRAPSRPHVRRVPGA